MITPQQKRALCKWLQRYPPYLKGLEEVKKLLIDSMPNDVVVIKSHLANPLFKAIATFSLQSKNYVSETDYCAYWISEREIWLNAIFDDLKTKYGRK